VTRPEDSERKGGDEVVYLQAHLASSFLTCISSLSRQGGRIQLTILHDWGWKRAGGDCWTLRQEKNQSIIYTQNWTITRANSHDDQKKKGMRDEGRGKAHPLWRRAWARAKIPGGDLLQVEARGAGPSIEIIVTHSRGHFFGG